MGEFIQDIVDAVKFGFSWLQDREVWKYYVGFVFLQLLLVGLIIGAIVAFVAGMAVTGTTYGSYGAAQAGAAFWLALGAGAILLFVVVLLLFIFFAMYLSLLVMAHAMNQKGIATIPITFRKTLSYLWLNFIVFLYSVFSWKDKRFLAVGLGALLSFLVFAASRNWFFLLLGLLLGTTYFFVVMYMGVRLNFSTIAFIQEEISVSEAIAVSWKMTENRALGVFARVAGSTITVSVLIALILLIPKVFIFILKLALPLLGIFVEQGFDILTSPISSIATLYAYTSIYFVYLQLHGLVEKQAPSGFSATAPEAMPAALEPVEPVSPTKRTVRRKKA